MLRTDVNTNSSPFNPDPESLLDSMSTAVVAIDQSLRIVFMNGAAEQLLGISARKAIEQKLTRILRV